MTSEARTCVVNADDFGLGDSVNRAIVESFEKGLISSTTMLANAAGFDEAVAMTKANGLNGKIGVHLNLTQFRPLTEPIRGDRRFVDSGGEFSFGLPRSTLWLASGARAAIRQEWAAQIRRCLDNGIVPTHLDSHHHIHTVAPLLGVAAGLAREFKIPYIRLTRNIGAGISAPKILFKAMSNAYIRSLHLAGTRYFGSVEDVGHLRPDAGARIEIMVHPRFDDGVLVDVVGGRRTTPLAGSIAALGIGGKMLSYSDVARDGGASPWPN